MENKQKFIAVLMTFFCACSVFKGDIHFHSACVISLLVSLASCFLGLNRWHATINDTEADDLKSFKDFDIIYFDRFCFVEKDAVTSSGGI